MYFPLCVGSLSSRRRCCHGGGHRTGDESLELQVVAFSWKGKQEPSVYTIKQWCLRQVATKGWSSMQGTKFWGFPCSLDGCLRKARGLYYCSLLVAVGRYVANVRIMDMKLQLRTGISLLIAVIVRPGSDGRQETDETRKLGHGSHPPGLGQPV